MTDNPEQIPVTSGSRNASSSTHTNNRSGNSSRQTRLQRNLTDVNNSDRDFTGAVEELGVLGTVLEKKHTVGKAKQRSVDLVRELSLYLISLKKNIKQMLH